MSRLWATSAALVFALALVTVGSQPTQAKKQLDGQEIFRFDTFDDEHLWTDVLRMHEALAEVTPATALAVGLKVDVDVLPPPVLATITAGQLDVNDSRVTRRLLEMNAVVGVVAKVADDRIKSVGITCALCHSTVDDALIEGIGRRLDGWPNLDLNVGAIVALSTAPEIAPFVDEFREWGPGKYHARHHIFDGTGLVLRHAPSLPVVIPPAYGLQNVGFETYTGDGPISYWNSYVGVTQMGGQGNFHDDRIKVAVSQKPDRVTPKLEALLAYQLSLLAPAPPPATIDAAAAARAQLLFNDPALGPGQCARCHIPPTYTDVSSGPIRRCRFFTAPVRSAPTSTTSSAARPSSIGRRRYAGCGSMRRTSTTDGRAIFRPSWTTTTMSSASASAPSRRPISSLFYGRCSALGVEAAR